MGSKELNDWLSHYVSHTMHSTMFLERFIKTYPHLTEFSRQGLLKLKKIKKIIKGFIT